MVFDISGNYVYGVKLDYVNIKYFSDKKRKP